MDKETLQGVAYYNEGQLISKVNKGPRRVGSILGSKHNEGYLSTVINKKFYLVHRLIYIYHYGAIEDTIQIDHIDGNRLNNKIENLRLVYNQENCFNRKEVKGYHFHRGKYCAEIWYNYKKIYLGRFNTEQEARDAYLLAKSTVHIIKDKRTHKDTGDWG